MTLKDEKENAEIWWGKVNMPMEPSQYAKVYQRALDYLNNRERIYVVDGYIGWDPKYKLRVRIFCTRAYHALFMNNMMIRPTQEELSTDFDVIDFSIYNAGEFYASPSTASKDSRTCVALNFDQKQGVILGT